MWGCGQVVVCFAGDQQATNLPSTIWTRGTAAPSQSPSGSSGGRPLAKRSPLRGLSPAAFFLRPAVSLLLLAFLDFAGPVIGRPLRHEYMRRPQTRQPQGRHLFPPLAVCALHAPRQVRPFLPRRSPRRRSSRRSVRRSSSGRRCRRRPRHLAPPSVSPRHLQVGR